MAFNFAASSSYILNDIKDASADAHHPEKKKRPIASGRISKSTSVALALLLLSLGVLLAYLVSIRFLSYLFGYLLISVCYTLWLKNYIFLDLIAISAGFIVRFMAGAHLFSIAVAPDLFSCVLLLSLFLSAGKRLNEKKRLGETAGEHRITLVKYPENMLKSIMAVTGFLVLISYCFFVAGKGMMLTLTVPICIFGLYRFYNRSTITVASCDPTESLLRDVPLFVTGLLWVGMTGWGIYGV